MTVLRRVFAFALLALWWPAALHCQMEASGVMEMGQCCVTKSGGTECGSLVANNDTKTVSSSLKTFQAAPVSDFVLLLAIPAVELTQVPSEWRQRSPDWLVTWQFVRRAAPAPRAPSLLLA